MTERLLILQGDCRKKLRELPDKSVHCCITSPPYFQLRDYQTGRWEGGDASCNHLQVDDKRDPATTKQTSNFGTARLGYGNECGKCGAKRIDAQIGLEDTPEQYVAALVAVFREVYRVLRDDGTAWINLGDSYSSGGSGQNLLKSSGSTAAGTCDAAGGYGHIKTSRNPKSIGLKPKDLIGIPWMVAFALRDDGWYLRQDIIWEKPNPMPESVTDRCTKSHEYIFLLAKQPHYFYDKEAIAEPASMDMLKQMDEGYDGLGLKDYESAGVQNPSIVKSRIIENARKKFDASHGGGGTGFVGHSGYFKENGEPLCGVTRNKRSVWTVTTAQFRDAHFATYPPALIRPMILAGTSAAGCCPKCLAPHQRVIESGYRAPADEKVIAEMLACGVPRQKANLYGHPSRDPKLYAANPDKTVGWKPTCDCNAGAPIPCTVLDPFSGSGTTAATAIELGRNAVAVELNADYVEMIKQRTNTTPGLPL